VLVRAIEALEDKPTDRPGLLDENAKLTDCYYEKKDWRVCTEEVSIFLSIDYSVYGIRPPENSC
jgi:hypothetical protein